MVNGDFCNLKETCCHYANIDGSCSLTVCKKGDKVMLHDKALIIDVVDDQPEVKAIPTEWIEKEIEKALSVDSADMFYASHLKYLIKKWEKENDL